MIKRLTNWAVAALCGVAFAAAANAQGLPPDCLQSFNVKQDQKIIYFGWLPKGAAVAAELSCPAAEALRENLFRGNVDGLTAADLSAALAVPDPLKAQRDLLTKRLVEIKAITTLDQAKAAGLVLSTTVAKYGAAYTCLTAETPPTAAACAGFVIALAKQGYALWKLGEDGLIGPARTAAAAEVQRQINDLDKIIAAGPPLKRSSLDKAKQLLLDAQTGLCQEIKKSCL